VNGVYADSSSIYAATINGGGLSISTNGGSNWTTYTTSNGLGNNTVRGVYADSSGIYAATGGGISISTNGGSNWTNYTTSNGLGNNTVYGIYADENNIYAATEGGLSIARLPVPNPVPAPLPVLGAMAALSGCRRLRATSRRLRER
jgi:hypothetical protein